MVRVVYYTSDLHFGHARIIELCSRPFENVTEMDEALIANWNRKVKQKDTVYIVGDIIWDKKRVGEYIERLNGTKILIPGNHDSDWAGREESKKYFSLVTKYHECSHNGHKITLCHYPMLEWRDSRESLKKTSYHIHGHIHNRISEDYFCLFRIDNALNCGVDINGFEPVTLEELIENNRAFKQRALLL